MIDKLFYSKLIDFVKSCGYECISSDNTIAVRESGKTRFLIRLEDLNPRDTLIDDVESDIRLDFKL